MNNLAVRTVDFMGDGLMVAKDNDGIVWAGVNSFCHGIGLSKNERDRQVKNIQADEVLSRGCVKFDAGVFDPNNETVALQLDYVPLWLAKISITPNMKENNPELVERLVLYQLKAKDVLAAAFLPQTEKVESQPEPPRERVRVTLYQNSRWGVLTIGDEAYNLTPDELSMFRKLIPRMHRRGIPNIPEVLNTYFAAQKRSGRMEKLGSILCGEAAQTLEETPAESEKRQDKQPTRSSGLQTDKSIPLDDIECLTEMQAKTRYSIGKKRLVAIAREAGAIIKIGNRYTYSRRVLDEYFQSLSGK